MLAISLGAGYIALDALFITFGVRYLPHRLHGALGWELYSLAQSTKRSALPEKGYVSILGDSYAEGYGDWRLEVLRGGGNGPYHAGHVLHRETGRDVLSFGRGGASSVQGMVSVPQALWRDINRVPLVGLGKPGTVFVYFFEGNDLIDNLRFLERTTLRQRTDLAELREAIRATVEPPTRSRASYLFSLALFGREMALSIMGKLPYPSPQSVGKAPTSAEVLAGGAVTQFHGLMGPNLPLPDEDFAPTVATFEASLMEAREFFSGADFHVVYIPAPLMAYPLVSTSLGIDGVETSAASLNSVSLKTCQAIAAAATRQGARFVDATPDIRSATTQGLVHGPEDMVHLNQRGNQALGHLLAKQLTQPGDPATPCAERGSLR